MLNRSRKFGYLWLIFCFIFVFSVSVNAQEQKNNKEKSKNEQNYVISAKAGIINYFYGDIYVENAKNRTRQILAKSDELANNDIIAVGQNGKAEILLNPGSFLRLGENSKVEFLDVSLDSLSLKIYQGSALFEVMGYGNDDAKITIATPQKNLDIAESGVYRLNVTKDKTELIVWNGKAVVDSQLVKSNRMVTFENGISTVAKYDKDNKDELDVWSKDRAKEMAKLNQSLSRRTLNNSLLTFSSGLNGFGSCNGCRFSRFAGIWVYNSLTNSYCYVPTGWGYWESPYGYWYNWGVVYNGNGGVINNPMVVNAKQKAFMNTRNDINAEERGPVFSSPSVDTKRATTTSTTSVDSKKP